MNLGIRNYEHASSLGVDWIYADKQNYKDVTLGFTLEPKSRVMMNEQVLNLPEDDQINIGTAGKIGIGVAVVAAVGLAVVVTIFATTDFTEDA